MAITYRTVTGNIGRLLGLDLPVDDSLTIRVRTNLLTGTAPIDKANNRFLVGQDYVKPDTNGDFTIANLIDYASADVNPTGIQYYFDLRYTDPVTRGAGKISLGPYSITANGDLSDIVSAQYVPPDFQSDFLDQANAILAQQEELSGIDSSDSAQAYNIDNGPLTKARLSASIVAALGNVTGLLEPKPWQDGPAFAAPAVTVQHGAATFASGRMAAGGVLHITSSAAIKAAIGAAGAFTLECIASFPVASFSAFAGVLILGEFNRGVIIDGATNAHYSPDDLPGSTSLYNNGDHHIALVCTCSSDRGTLLTQKVYVDGALQITGATNVAAGAQATDGFYVGGSKDGANGMAASLKAVRLSRSARYTGAHTAPTDFTAAAVDADTLALLPLDTTIAPYTGAWPSRGATPAGYAFWPGPATASPLPPPEAAPYEQVILA